VKVFFRETDFPTQFRKELRGNIDFLANCGGLLGLCLGVSVISFLELIYFCTIRQCFGKRQRDVDRGETIVVEEFQKLHSRSNRFLKTIKDITVEYLEKTTIKGIQNIVESKLTPIERIWWTIVMIFSVFCCGSLIADIFEQYDKSPVVISYAKEETLISNVEYKLTVMCLCSINIPFYFSRFPFPLSQYAHK
jgi:Amiloride-sensitive sodium channel